MMLAMKGVLCVEFVRGVGRVCVHLLQTGPSQTGISDACIEPLRCKCGTEQALFEQFDLFGCVETKPCMSKNFIRRVLVDCAA